MNLTTYELALIAGGFAITGALIGALATYRLSINLIQRTHKNAIALMQEQEFSKAAALFRTAFTDELRELKRIIDYDEAISEDKVLQMLNSSRTKFENACINFSPYIIQSQRISFDNAWKEYCHPHGGNPKQMSGPFYEYFTDISGHDSVTLIIEKIDKLLEFAKPK